MWGTDHISRFKEFFEVRVGYIISVISICFSFFQIGRKMFSSDFNFYFWSGYAILSFLNISSVERLLPDKKTGKWGAWRAWGEGGTGGVVRDGHTITHTNPSRLIFGFGAFQPMELVLENSFENKKIEVIWGCERSSKVSRGRFSMLR